MVDAGKVILGIGIGCLMLSSLVNEVELIRRGYQITPQHNRYVVGVSCKDSNTMPTGEVMPDGMFLVSCQAWDGPDVDEPLPTNPDITLHTK